MRRPLGPSRRRAGALVVLLSGAAAADDFDSLGPIPLEPFRLTAEGIVTSSGHPTYPFEFHEHALALELDFHPQLGECKLKVTLSDQPAHTLFVRRGRILERDDEGKDAAPSGLGDLGPATLAALHPAVLANALRERRDMVRSIAPHELLFAWNDELWTVQTDPESGLLAGLRRRTYHDVHGDGDETIVFEGGTPGFPAVVTVAARGRSLARLEFHSPEPIAVQSDAAGKGAAWSFPEGDRRRDRARLVAPEELAIERVADHLFTIDIATMNTRVMIAEFEDHLVVLEGVYNSRNGDRIARLLRARFDQPVGYFAFSHLHDQYIGGVRTWIHAGATILVPPATRPLVEKIAADSHALRPDALAREPTALALEEIEGSLRLEDDRNALEVFNIDSDHTQDYLLFYFPRQRVVLAGDLLWYRPGQVLTGRSVRLCEAVERLALEVDRYFCTWPLDGYGTLNIVTAEQMAGACPGR